MVQTRILFKIENIQHLGITHDDPTADNFKVNNLFKELHLSDNLLLLIFPHAQFVGGHFEFATRTDYEEG